jgi:hypothetical protein
MKKLNCLRLEKLNLLFSTQLQATEYARSQVLGIKELLKIKYFDLLL